MDHAVEIYLSRAPTHVTDAASLHALRLLFEYLPRSLDRPGDDGAQLACPQASWLSMPGVANVTLGLSHGIGHQIGARCGVPHGITSCVMLPTVMTRMVMSCRDGLPISRPRWTRPSRRTARRQGSRREHGDVWQG